jgi:hypothetical protein
MSRTFLARPGAAETLAVWVAKLTVRSNRDRFELTIPWAQAPAAREYGLQPSELRAALGVHAHDTQWQHADDHRATTSALCPAVYSEAPWQNLHLRPLPQVQGP